MTYIDTIHTGKEGFFGLLFTPLYIEHQSFEGFLVALSRGLRGEGESRWSRIRGGYPDGRRGD